MKRFALTPLFCLAISIVSAQSLTGTRVVTGLSSPIVFVQHPTNRSMQFIVQQGGIVKTVINGVVQGTPLVDLTTDVLSGGEQGLLGMAFAPDYSSSHHVYFNFTREGPVMQVARFTVSNSNPPTIDDNTRLDIISTPRANSNHNGGTIAFGTDGYLYIGMGDGGGSGDPTGNGQNPDTWLGKMLRIDPRTDDFPADPARNYHIPADNPFVDSIPIAAQKEIWSFGLRNPFKFSFDDPNLLGTGALIIGDVGQDAWEEIDYEPARQGGSNYGWRRFEGFSQFSASTLAYIPHATPSFVYNHSTGEAVIGGRVYRGLQLGSDYFGRYFYCDNVSGRIWSLRFYFDNAIGRWRAFDLREHTSDITPTLMGSPCSIDVDSFGELYVVDLNGNIVKISKTNATWLHDFSVQNTTIKSGSLRNVIGLDDRFLDLEPSTPLGLDAQVSFVGTTNRPSSTFLDFEAVGKVSTGSAALLRMYCKRWSDGQWVQVRAENMDATKRRFRAAGLSAATYVRAGDGRIEVRLLAHKSIQNSTGYRVSWDQVVATAR
ncbi:MAG: PQQ-dependent sugar dehydrogenase [Armatimonadetes bacterium]|nr:PQQ-dependent sugar dehydrogenase [Armatimonadota bacterium]